jgi:hypothetical protein
VTWSVAYRARVPVFGKLGSKSEGTVSTGEGPSTSGGAISASVSGTVVWCDRMVVRP